MKTETPLSYLTDVALAFVLLTRWPMPKLPATAFDTSARAVWAYPLVGLALGALGYAIAAAATAVGLPAFITAGLVLGAMLLSTGAMHEDGLADCADGFWGAQDTKNRLAIMKDSQIGSYGTLALIIVLGLRWGALTLLLPLSPLVLIAAAALSRAAMPLLMHLQPNARDSGLSRQVGRPAIMPVIIGLTLAFGIAFATTGALAVTATMVTLIGAAAVGAISRSKIGGQTGDVLGATQQICELLALICFVMLYT